MTLAQKGDYLLSLALEHGGKDNVSLILLDLVRKKMIVCLFLVLCLVFLKIMVFVSI